MSKRFRHLRLLSATVFLVVITNYESLAQGPWSLTFGFYSSGYRTFIGTVDGQSVNIPIFEMTYRIESNSGYVSGTLYNSSGATVPVNYTPSTRFDNTDFGFGFMRFHGSLCVNFESRCPDLVLSVGCTVSAAYYGYSWELTNDPWSSSSPRYQFNSYDGRLNVTQVLQWTGLNTDTYLYARVTDSWVPAGSPWSAPFMVITDKSVQGGGTYCDGQTVTITMPATQPGITYTLTRNDGLVHASQLGGGGALYWPVTPGAGTWTYTVSGGQTGCTQGKSMSQRPVVVVNPPPADLPVTTSYTPCVDTYPSRIIMANSEQGVNYRLERHDGVDGGTVTGNGSTIYWDVESNSAGTWTYTITATKNTCPHLLSARPTLSFHPRPNAVVSGPSVYCTGGPAIQLTASYGEGYTYQWHKVNTGPLSGETGRTLNVASPGSYWVTVTSAYGCTQNSEPKDVSEVTVPLLTVTGPSLVCTGSAITLEVPPGYAYQWLKDEVIQGGQTGLTLTVNSGGNYQVDVTAQGCTRRTNAKAVTQYTLPEVTVTGPSFFCAGTSATLTASSGEGFTYQWFRNGSTLSGQTGVSLTVNTAGTYSVQATASNGCSKVSAGKPVEERPLPVVTINGASHFCAGNSTTLTATVSNVAADAYQWLRNDQPLPGETGPSLNVASEGTYRVSVTGNGCGALSGPKIVSDGTPPLLTITGPPIVCEEGTITLEVSGGYSYQWIKDNGIVDGQTGSSLTVQSPGSYQVDVTANGCTRRTDAKAVALHSFPAVITGPSSFCAGSSTVLTAQSGEGYGYQWYQNGSSMSGETSQSLTVNAPGTYTVQVSSSGCTKQSPGQPVAERPSPVVNINGASHFCADGSYPTLTAVISGPADTYQWLRNGEALPGETGTEIHALVGGDYRMQVCGNGCSSLSPVHPLEERPLPTATISGPSSVCLGNTITLTAGWGEGYTYQWRKNGADMAGETAATLAVSEQGGYDVAVTANACTSPSRTIAVETGEPPVVSISGQTVICAGSGSVLVVTGGSGELTYQWKKDDAVIPGATSATHTVTEAGGYTCVANTGICNTESNNLTVTVAPLPVVDGVSGDLLPVMFEKTTYSATGVSPTDKFIWHLPVDASVTYPAALRDEAGILFTSPGIQEVSVSAKRGECVSAPFRKTVNVQLPEDSLRIPEGVKITREGRQPVQSRERQFMLSTLHDDDTLEVFQSPPCLDGRYYAGFQLYYDLGDMQTLNDWAGNLDITLLHEDDSVWTKRIQVDMTTQTFIATVFHDSLISCDDNYYVVINQKTIAGQAPQENIYFKILLFREAENLFNPSAPLTLNCQYTGQETMLGWSYDGEGAVAYDIEWVFIEDHERFTGTTPQEAFAFKRAVRVTTAGAGYKHPVHYPKGRVWYRARAVGYNPQFPRHRIPGYWYYSPCAAITVQNPQPDMNWLSQTVYAEGGKYRKSLHYYDGSLRERQAQTNLSTEDLTLVGETLYDYEGRQAVTILPVPASDATLTYKTSFNVFESVDPLVAANTSAIKKKFHYDNHRLENSIVSTQNGAGRYYSEANTQAMTHRDYIPDADGYVYGQTEYFNEPQSRLSRQSGTGEVFRADGSHVIRYFDGSVTQEELVRLFGRNVGNATHYKKLMQVDANGQVSITYQDQERRTIATALAGENPGNVDSLQSLKDLDPVPSTVKIDPANQRRSGRRETVHKILNVAPNTAYTFTYDLSVLASEVEEIGCTTCGFDLKIIITDPDGSPLDLSHVAGNQSPDGLSFMRNNITADSCTAPYETSVQFTVALTDIGDYTVIKQLAARELTFEDMKVLVEERTSVQEQISQIRQSYVSDASECEICSEGCPEAEAAIAEAIEETTDEECENILDEIREYFREKYDTEGGDPYEVPEDSIVNHPLHCKYLLCAKNRQSVIFEKQLTRVDNWNAAVSAGYSNLIAIDPFFNVSSLSGYNYKTAMQAKLDNLLVAQVGYDADHNGTQDGTREYRGTIGQITDPSNTAYYIDDYGNHNPSNGYHLLYLSLMKQRSGMTEAAYQAELGAQRWLLYRSYYLEAKRKTKLEITEIQNCADAQRDLEIPDGLPQTEEDIIEWGEANGWNEPAEPATLEMTIYNIENTCNISLSAADSTAIAASLQAYFTPDNFFRVIKREELGVNGHLVDIQNRLNNYGCRLDSIAVDDPLTCLRDTVIVMPLGSGIVPEARMAMLQTGNAGEDESLASYQATYEQEMRERLDRELEVYVQEQMAEAAQAENTQQSGIITLSTPLPDPAEYAALMDLYNATNGPLWHNKGGWKDANPNVVQSLAGWHGVVTDDQGHVTALLLHSNNLNGTIPASIGSLSFLRNLTLRNNRLSGPIPPQVGSLVSLQTLLLFSNNLSGGIPPQLGNLHDLEVLSLRDNPLGGTIPGEFIGLNNIKILHLSSAQLTGPFPMVVTSLTSLQSLDLAFNGFTGAIPSQLSALNDLENLTLASNSFVGPIPETLEIMSKLKLLHLGANQLSGTIPTSLGTLENLEDLRLDNNNLSGSIPEQLGDLINLKRLSLGLNSLTGTIPDALGNTQLLFLNLTNNQLEGQIPASISNLPLQDAYFSSNHLSGQIPQGLRTVTRLHLDGNRYLFADILPVSLNFTGSTFNYGNQALVDVPKTHTTFLGYPITLQATVERNVQPPCHYQWFRYVNGVNDVPLNTASVDGHTYTVPAAEPDVRYYYRITNTSATGLTLQSHLQDVSLLPSKVFTMCLEYDTANATIEKFNYTVNLNDEVQKCMANLVEEDSILTEYAIEKLIEAEVTELYKSYQTNCLSKTAESFSYTFQPKEYHYTLYYYDQAGNLVQTVPPQGVKPLRPEQVTAILNGGTGNPEHNLVTNYWYNSLDQLVTQKTPDAGTSGLWYNSKGQVRLSRNAQQNLDDRYSYSRYDELGRVIEAGELTTALPLTTLLDRIDDLSFPDPALYRLTDRVKTYYDLANTSVQPVFEQQNLRNRVSWTEVTASHHPLDTIRTFYSYDIHGNVQSLLQQLPGLDAKRTDYVYDLVSGKVNYVMYQYGKPDQFIHQYTYDADNRITDVYTSSDGFIWNREANYSYYLHGPLARTELGEYRVQGLDYYYTLQGWIKGVNMPFANDPGEDGENQSKVGKDAFAYSLGYYQGDYKPVNNSVVIADNRDQLWSRAQENIQHTGLYNGNISWMVTDIPKIGELNNDRTKGVQAMLYRYDQLHRITQARSLTSYNESTGFATRDASAAPYDADYSYDANGNLLTLQRKDQQGNTLHDFNYQYYTGTNRLRSTRPAEDMVYSSGPVTSNATLYRKITLQGDAYVPAGATVRLRAQEEINVHPDFRTEDGGSLSLVIAGDEGMYQYDAIGNLVLDQYEGVKIEWTPYGKVSEVRAKSDSVIVTYLYDGTGNRVSKKVVRKDTVDVVTETQYIRDASGNVMAIYSNTTLIEQPVYGSSRIGQYYGKVIAGRRTLGRKNYELSNHLGNILAVITDNIGMSQDSVWATVSSTSDYYPFGLEMEGRTWSDSTSASYRHGFNGKEKDTMGDAVYDYGFRIYNPAIGKFLSVDPLTKEYPMLTPYQFASSRPIDGIDLDGLEYLRADEARIKMKGGEAHINLDNFYTVTQMAWEQRNAAGNWPPGYIGFPTKAGEFTNPSIPKYPESLSLDDTYTPPNPARLVGTQNIDREIPIAASTGVPDRRHKPRPPTPMIGSGAGKAGKATAGVTVVLNGILWGLEQYSMYAVNEDRNLVKEHMSILEKYVTRDLNRALELGLIPDKYQNIKNLGEISNVILSGVNPTDDPEIYKIGIKIVKQVSGNYQPKVEDVYHFKNSDSADNTRVNISKPIFKYE